MIKIAAVVTAVVISLIVIITLAVAKSASQEPDNQKSPIYKYRTAYFFFLIISIVVLLVITLKSDRIPYPDTKGIPDITVNVTGRTWSWDLSLEEIPVNRLIDFSLQTEDVNHGFAIYTSEGKILAQAQVMPGYTNHLRVKFDKPGEYKVLCLEYCGVSHHKMMTSFNVVEEKTISELGGEK